MKLSNLPASTTSLGLTVRDHAVCELPDLSTEDLRSLRSSISVSGVIYPVLIDHTGAVIDGLHRWRIALELGYECPVDTIPNLATDDCRMLRRSLNIARRHLTSNQKRQLIAEQLNETPGRSDRFIAKYLGVDHKTVGRVRKAILAEDIAELIGIDGKSRNYWKYRRSCQDTPTTIHPTPPTATMALLDRENFTGTILEPANGNGAISKVLSGRGLKVIARDILTGHDFLKTTDRFDNVITNPPYSSRLIEGFIRKAMTVAARKIAMLLPLFTLEGRSRVDLFTDPVWRLKAVYIFAQRPYFYDQTGKPGNVPFGVAWVVWEKHFSNPSVLSWIS